MLTIKKIVQKSGAAVRTEPPQPATAATPEDKGNTRTISGEGQKRQLKPLRSKDGGRNYRGMYRAVWEFHERHSPPSDDEESDYWEGLCSDIIATGEAFENDPFIVDLLSAVHAELEREYSAMQDRRTV